MDELDESGFSMSDVALDRLLAGGVTLAIEKLKIKGLPIGRYDSETKRAYLEFPDGHREYVAKNRSESELVQKEEITEHITNANNLNADKNS